MAVVFSSNMKENSKLFHNGYTYFKDKNREDKWYWRCTQSKIYDPTTRKRTRFCGATASTIFTDGHHEVKSAGIHCHGPDPTILELNQTRKKLKDAAVSTADKPAKIINQLKSTMNENIAIYLPNDNALRQTILRERKKKSGRPTEPKDIDNLIHLPLPYKTTVEGQEFLIPIYDDQDSGAMMIFTTTDDLHRLSKCEFWIMDGTFDVTPPLFNQMYSIHGAYGNEKTRRILPFVYVFMLR